MLLRICILYPLSNLANADSKEGDTILINSPVVAPSSTVSIGHVVFVFFYKNTFIMLLRIICQRVQRTPILHA
jgi:hypothetical protein